MSQKNSFNFLGFSKNRLMRRAVYVVIGLAAWFAQQQGWLNLDKSGNNSTNSHQQDSQRVETHTNSSRNKSIKKEPIIVESTNQSSGKNDNKLIAQLYKQKTSDKIVTAVGKVGKILPDDNKGSRHQKFLLDIGQAKWLLVAHNIDLAQKVPLRQGDPVIVHGEYEWTEKGGVLHWTHHDPRGYHEDGYIEHNGKRYK